VGEENLYNLRVGVSSRGGRGVVPWLVDRLRCTLMSGFNPIQSNSIHTILFILILHFSWS